ncbi:hypothetical protein DFH09DRAFT_1084744 [Mycena vulgaris]|nr:hypothetical protein DFH09DRAFT_1084744 [Mycena vulgaris]
MQITLSSVAGCDMIKRGPLRLQKGEHHGGLEDCVQSKEWSRIECDINTIPSLAILSCIFRGALQENLISKNEAIDWMCAGEWLHPSKIAPSGSKSHLWEFFAGGAIHQRTANQPPDGADGCSANRLI